MKYRITWENEDTERFVKEVEASDVDEAIELWEKTAKESDFIVEILGGGKLIRF